MARPKKNKSMKLKSALRVREATELVELQFGERVFGARCVPAPRTRVHVVVFAQGIHPWSSSNERVLVAVGQTLVYTLKGLRTCPIAMEAPVVGRGICSMWSGK